jgi:hypothetical protein
MSAPTFPPWLHWLAVLGLAINLLCAVAIVADETRRSQPMMIMNAVWPLAALFGGLAWLWLYLRHGRPPQPDGPPMWVAVAKGTSHCGAGCALGDIVAEWLAFAWPGIAAAFGWGTLFAEKTFAIWLLDFLLAFLFGIAFQYFTIKPMRQLSVRRGLAQALKADAASIAAWQLGMYGCMAELQFGWARSDYGAIARVDSPEFWFFMQIAMLGGFVTAFPVNWVLVRTGVKEKM